MHCCTFWDVRHREESECIQHPTELLCLVIIFVVVCQAETLHFPPDNLGQVEGTAVPDS